MPKVPQLLVSVRDSDEARTAVLAGADIIDVKEPSRGSLGMADLDRLPGILGTVRELRPDVPVSIACGEAAERDHIKPILLPAGVRFAKLGLAGAGNRENWRENWSQARQQVSFSDSNTEWIAVAYVDWRQACSPQPEAVIYAAAEQSCAGVLFDTWSKHSGRLFDWLTAGQLEAWASMIHHHGLRCAVAGRLQVEDIPRLRNLPVDVIAVRSAACTEGDRQGTISAAAVVRFRKVLRAENWAVAVES